MSIEVVPHPIPFLKEALTLGDLEDFKPRLKKLLVKENIPNDFEHSELEMCKTVLYDKGWYRGDAELTHDVSVVFLWWYELSGGRELFMKRAYDHFHLLGDYNFKFFGHLDALYQTYEIMKK
ncbi:hypothetical protein [Vibrio phage phiKT1019]|nr:hypothetical protein [Vibrio phage phiKT1019]